MKRTKEYSNARFSAEVIKEAASVFDSQVSDEGRADDDPILTLETSEGEEEWSYDSENEFYGGYRQGPRQALYNRIYFGIRHEPMKSMRIRLNNTRTIVSVDHPSRPAIEEVFEVFEKHLESSTLPKAVPEKKAEPTIFIGHGRSNQWRDLKDHLQDQHGHNIEAYEVGARAGHAVRDILEDMTVTSSFAVLVLSAEDKDDEGNFHARANVVHELGLFQGKLGFSRAIVLLEESTQEFSNIQGIQQIRYSKGNIRETFGDVLATIRREFGADSA